MGNKTFLSTGYEFLLDTGRRILVSDGIYTSFLSWFTEHYPDAGEKEAHHSDIQCFEYAHDCDCTWRRGGIVFL